MDVCVTVPRGIWLEWIEEGDAVDAPDSGEEWGYYIGPRRPPAMQAGDRVYIVSHGRLRGYAPLTRIGRDASGNYALCRRGGAVAVTVPNLVIPSVSPGARPGFRGVRPRWWDRRAEIPYPDWATDGVELPCVGGCRPRAMGGAFFTASKDGHRFHPLCRPCAMAFVRRQAAAGVAMTDKARALLAEVGPGDAAVAP